MTTEAADVLADPVGVIVDLVASVELALDRTAITAVVTQRGGRPGQAAPARPGPGGQALGAGRRAVPGIARPPGTCSSPCARPAR